jgi:succinyl-CoA synthetase beta subunit
MIIHEYQSKILLKRYGLLIPKGILIKSFREIKIAIFILRSSKLVIKSQIHSNRRYILGLIKFIRLKYQLFLSIKNILYNMQKIIVKK